MTDPEPIIRKHAARVREVILAEIEANYDALVELAVFRSSTTGVAEYGDASFHKPPAKLRWDRFEEYADAIFYAAIDEQLAGE